MPPRNPPAPPPPPGDDDPRDPGPWQSRINRRQGDVNDRQGDVNDEVLDELARRADVGDVERGDAEHRADLSEAAAEASTERRDAEHAAQAQTNTAQAEVNVAQLVINSEAVIALGKVADAAREVTDLLRVNVSRAKRWTYLLAAVVLAVAVLGALVYVRFRHDSDVQRRLSDRIVAQQTTAATLGVNRCEDRNAQLVQIRGEFVTLVRQVTDTIVDPVAKARAEEFLVSYRTGLEARLRPISCR